MLKKYQDNLELLISLTETEDFVNIYEVLNNSYETEIDTEILITLYLQYLYEQTGFKTEIKNNDLNILDYADNSLIRKINIKSKEQDFSDVTNSLNKYKNTKLNPSKLEMFSLNSFKKDYDEI